MRDSAGCLPGCDWPKERCHCPPTWWNDPVRWDKAPVAAAVLLQGANVGQLWRMWTERTAAGQSLVAWLSVFLALVLYANFYRVCTPNQLWARRMAVIGVLFNVSVVLTVIYFRYLV